MNSTKSTLLVVAFLSVSGDSGMKVGGPPGAFITQRGCQLDTSRSVLTFYQDDFFFRADHVKIIKNLQTPLNWGQNQGNLGK